MTASDPNARETGLVTYDKFLGGAVTVVQPAKASKMRTASRFMP